MRKCCDEVNRLLMQNYSNQELQNWKLIVESNDASNLWKGEIQNSIDREKSPSTDALADHFQSKSCIDVEDEEMFVHNANNYIYELDKPITVDEVEDESKHLQPSKSLYDGWSPLMITSISFLDTQFCI